MMLSFNIKKLARSFVKGEDGSYTVFGLYILVVFLMLGSIAVDYNNAFTVRTKMQVATDKAAHAAIYKRQFMDADAAKAEAIKMVEYIMPAASYGSLLTASDIVYGQYDKATETFTADPSSKDAVAVRLQRLQSKGNGIRTFMLHLVGLQGLDVTTLAIAETFTSQCDREGVITEGVVDMQSGNIFTNGYCVHASNWVEVANGNTFDDGVIVSMPDISDVVGTVDDGSNPGLAAALRSHGYQLDIAGRIQEYIADLQLVGERYSADFVTDPIIIDLSLAGSKNFAPSDFDANPNRIWVTSGNCGPGVLFSGGPSTPTFRNAVFITDCKVNMSAQLAFEDFYLATTSTLNNSIATPAKVTLGRDDNCAPGGGAFILSMGGVSFAAQLTMYDGKVMAAKDLNVAANESGVQGASLMSGTRVDLSSGSTFGFCGSGDFAKFSPPYYRLAY